MTDKDKNYSDKLAEVAEEVEENKPEGNVDPLEGYAIEDPDVRGSNEGDNNEANDDTETVVAPVLGAADPSVGVNQTGTGQAAVPPPVVETKKPLTDEEKEAKLRE